MDKHNSSIKFKNFLNIHSIKVGHNPTTTPHKETIFSSFLIIPYEAKFH